MVARRITTRMPWLRRALLRLEGGFWLTRPQSAFSKVPMAVAAWTVGRGDFPDSALKLGFLVLFLVVLQALLFVINDINDAERDRLSAPYMPIPSGVMTRGGAVGEALVLGALFVTSVGVISSGLGSLLAVLATIPPALATMYVYGRTKSTWFSPLMASTASSSAPLWAWLLAGHRNGTAFALLFAITTLHGLHANLRAQLRDIEGDPKAGNFTLAYRLGAKRTFWLAAAIRILELVLILGLGLYCGIRGSLLWLLPALALLVFGLATARDVYAETRDRIGQTEALTLWVYISFLTEIAILGAFRPLLALPTAVVMFAWFRCVRWGYYARLVSGRLALVWEGGRGGDGPVAPGSFPPSRPPGHAPEPPPAGAG
jgi:4-hydroxybenzoate polyprenyltransferase